MYLVFLSQTLKLPFSACQCRLPVWPDWPAQEQPPWQVRAPWMGPALVPVPTLTALRESQQSPRPWKCHAKWGMRWWWWVGRGGGRRKQKEQQGESIDEDESKLVAGLSVSITHCKISCIVTESSVQPVTPSLKGNLLSVTLMLCCVFSLFACTLF